MREDANIGPMNSERVLSWDTLAPAAQLQLLGNSFMRVRDGCTVVPLRGLPGLAGLYALGLGPPGITLWGGAALLLGVCHAPRCAVGLAVRHAASVNGAV